MEIWWVCLILDIGLAAHSRSLFVLLFWLERLTTEIHNRELFNFGRFVCPDLWTKLINRNRPLDTENRGYVTECACLSGNSRDVVHIAALRFEGCSPASRASWSLYDAKFFGVGFISIRRSSSRLVPGKNSFLGLWSVSMWKFPCWFCCQQRNALWELSISTTHVGSFTSFSQLW